MRRPRSNAIPIHVLAKAPVPGRAKTRLVPALGEEGAARLAQRLLERTVATASAVAPVMLWCDPDFDHPAFEALARVHSVALRRQPDTDLGYRMHAAFEAQSPALLVGTDCPGLSSTILQRAQAELRDKADVVFVPALDGGYVLVGLRKPMVPLFKDMIWSTPKVMEETRARVRSLGLSVSELEPLPDIDTPDDLVHLPADWPEARPGAQT